MTTTLIIPGLHSSGTAHWQSWFEAHIPGTVRVIQTDWDDANLADWAARVRRDITRTPGKLFLVAHSFGALAAAQAAYDHSERIAGALFVAPADPDKFDVREQIPASVLPFQTVVVASTNDPWISLDQAAAWADRWGADLVNIGAAGHINVDAGFGPWPEGLALFERLRRRAELSDIIDEAAAQYKGPRMAPDVRRRWRSTPALQHRPSAESRVLQNAATLLREAGWHVAPPREGTSVVTGARQ